MLRLCLIFPIRLYQVVISPLIPGRCRFHPTCSAYSIEAIQRHGSFRGTWLMLKRLAKCGPWHAGGIDPVPIPPDSRFVRSSSDGR